MKSLLFQKFQKKSKNHGQHEELAVYLQYQMGEGIILKRREI